MSFDIAAFIKKFAPSFAHALGHLDRRIDCPRHFAGFGLRRLLRASDCPHAYGHGKRLRPWLSCPARLRTSGIHASKRWQISKRSGFLKISDKPASDALSRELFYEQISKTGLD
jgi:hypothetical protein